MMEPRMISHRWVKVMLLGLPSSFRPNSSGMMVRVAAEAEPAANVHGLDVILAQTLDVAGIPLDEPFITVMDAVHFDVAVGRFNRDGADDAVDAGGRSSADNQRQTPNGRKARHESTSS